MRCYGLLAAFALLSPLAVLVPPHAAAAAPDCEAIRAHVEQARAALVEADSYAARAETPSSVELGRRAYRELQAADRGGTQVRCYDRAAYVEYAAALAHATGYEMPFLPLADLRAADDKIQTILRSKPAEMRKVNPTATASLVNWAKVVHEGRLFLERRE